MRSQHGLLSGWLNGRHKSSPHLSRKVSLITTAVQSRSQVLKQFQPFFFAPSRLRGNTSHVSATPRKAANQPRSSGPSTVSPSALRHLTKEGQARRPHLFGRRE